MDESIYRNNKFVERLLSENLSLKRQLRSMEGQLESDRTHHQNEIGRLNEAHSLEVADLEAQLSEARHAYDNYRSHVAISFDADEMRGYVEDLPYTFTDDELDQVARELASSDAAWPTDEMEESLVQTARNIAQDIADARIEPYLKTRM